MKKLTKYNSKRNFSNTLEPEGKIKNTRSKKLKFCVQHHIASRDHYDFRLEWEGVLLSWAIPKGPSYYTKDKRLAVKVEDHPYSYRNFEGTIPEGEYGGGIVMLWDRGYYKPIGNFKKDLKNGAIKFILKGERLKGSWTLINFKEDNWLLIKENDEYANIMDISKFKRSVKSNLTMQEIKKKSKR